MDNTNNFDKKKEYETQIKKTVQELKQLCNKAHIPMFFAACISNDNNDSQYEIELLSAKICETKLTKDWLSDFVNITLGFDTIVPSGKVEIDIDDLV